MPCVYLPGPAPAVTVANNNIHTPSYMLCRYALHNIILRLERLAKCRFHIKKKHERAKKYPILKIDFLSRTLLKSS
jgi:hypothetical protein